MRTRAGNDRGEVSLQVVLLTPVVLLLVLASVQAALWYHAAQIADSAAADGAQAAARYGAGPSDGSVALAALVADAGGSLVRGDVAAVGERMVASATVRVAGVLPGWPVTVTRRAEVPIERLTPGGGG